MFYVTPSVMTITQISRNTLNIPDVVLLLKQPLNTSIVMWNKLPAEIIQSIALFKRKCKTNLGLMQNNIAKEQSEFI